MTVSIEISEIEAKIILSAFCSAVSSGASNVTKSGEHTMGRGSKEMTLIQDNILKKLKEAFPEVYEELDAAWQFEVDGKINTLES